MPNQLPHFGVTAPTCPICNKQINVHQQINPGHCGAMACNLEHAAQVGLRREAEQRKALQDRVDAALLRESATLEAAADRLETEPHAVLVAAVPFLNKPVVPLPQDVRETFADHIQNIVAAAFEDVSMAPQDAPHDPPLLKVPTPIETAGCTACQGYCCRLGRNSSAFLNKSKIENLIRANPALSMPQVIDRYVTAIPKKSVQDSCVYHSAQGCALPRDWRSDACNTYRCDQLVTMANRALEGDDLPFAILGVSESESKVLLHRDSLGTIDV